MRIKINRAQILSQIRANIVAIFSIIVALSGMAYNTWRNERTEINHSVRIAAFETLKNLGEAQIVVEYLHFQKNRQLGDPVQGWGRMIYIRDLAQVLPARVRPRRSGFGQRGGTMSRASGPTTRRW